MKPQPHFVAPGQHKTDFLEGTNAGDKSAPMQALERLSRRLRAVARRTLAPQLRGLIDPEDIVQEAGLAILRKGLPETRNDSDFLRYACGVVRNLARMHNRKHLDGKHHCRHNEVPVGALKEDEMPISRGRSAHSIVQEKEMASWLLDWLPPRVRNMLFWVVAGYSAAEVAAILDIEEETIILFLCDVNNLRARPEDRINKQAALMLFRREQGRRLRIHRRAALCG